MILLSYVLLFCFLVYSYPIGIVLDCVVLLLLYCEILFYLIFDIVFDIVLDIVCLLS
ncbi:hypothetical protein BY996DRAFT_7143836, partial [Phakopsora pachyrhizi]